jgi:hypothetical protein
MFHLYRATANKLVDVVIRHQGYDKKLPVYLPVVEGKVVMSEEVRIKVYNKLGCPYNLPYLLKERAYIRTGVR